MVILLSGSLSWDVFWGTSQCEETLGSPRTCWRVLILEGSVYLEEPEQVAGEKKVERLLLRLLPFQAGPRMDGWCFPVLS